MMTPDQRRQHEAELEAETKLHAFLSEVRERKRREALNALTPEAREQYELERWERSSKQTVDDKIVRYSIRDPEAGYWDRLVEQQREARYDYFADWHLPPAQDTDRPIRRREKTRLRFRVPLEEMDRGAPHARRSTKHIAKTAPRQRGVHQFIRSDGKVSVPDADSFSFANGLCNAPLAFAGKKRSLHAVDCPITANGLTPGVLEVQLLALVTGQALLAMSVSRRALSKDRVCVDGAGDFRAGDQFRTGYIRVPFASRTELLTRLHRDGKTQQANHVALNRALAYLSAAELKRPTLTNVIRVEHHGARGALSVWVSLAWLDFNKKARHAGVTILDLEPLLKLREPSHVNAYFALAAWARTLRRPGDGGCGKNLIRPLSYVCWWLGIQYDRPRRNVEALECAVAAVAKVTGVPYGVSVTERRSGQLVRFKVYVPDEEIRETPDWHRKVVSGWTQGPTGRGRPTSRYLAA